MTSKPQIGRNVFNEQLVRGRHATEDTRDALRRLIEDQPGPQTTALLIAKLALSISQIEAVLTELDKIGRDAKNGTK